MCKGESGAIYGLGFIGALVYNIQYAHGFEQVLWGVVKSFLWPVYLVYEVLLRLAI